MNRLMLLTLTTLLLSFSAYSQSQCSEDSEAVMPVLSPDVIVELTSKLMAAENEHKTEKSADSLIWVGRRTAYLGEYKKAIKIFSEGIKKYPEDARFLRHRGHRLISIRCLDDAIKDFESAAKLIKDQPDTIEPDGLPNARNTPTSTLQSNIWYHLGLAYYIKGDYNRALDAYRECLKVSKNPDMLVATTNWLFVTLKRLGKDKEAAKVLIPIKKNLDIIENDTYFQLIRMYKGEIKSSELAGSDGDELTNATLLYGVGNWELINGRTDNARKYFERVLKSNQWSSFGYIAAEAEMDRLGVKKLENDC